MTSLIQVADSACLCEGCVKTLVPHELLSTAVIRSRADARLAQDRRRNPGERRYFHARCEVDDYDAPPCRGFVSGVLATVAVLKAAGYVFNLGYPGRTP